MSRGHDLFGDVLILKGYYYTTIHVYQHSSSSSVYIEESKHHNGKSVTNLIDTAHMTLMIQSFNPLNVYTGFSKKHPYRNDNDIGGYWLHKNGTFTHIGMDDDDLLMHLTRDSLMT